MTTAGVFNPAQRMVIPTGGIDFSSYLGGGYMTNPFSFGTANMFSVIRSSNLRCRICWQEILSE